MEKNHLTVKQKDAYWNDGYLFPIAAANEIQTKNWRNSLEKIEHDWLDNGLTRSLESGTGTLLKLMETLHAESETLKYGNSNKLLHQVAMKKASLAMRTGEEIAARALKQSSGNKWVRETLLRIITGINASAAPSEDYELPPIIIC